MQDYIVEGVEILLLRINDRLAMITHRVIIQR